MGKDQRVKTFKDVLRSDIKSVFLNFEEFGEEHEINGETVLIIIDENELTEREKRIRRGIDAELHKSSFSFMSQLRTLVLFRRPADFWIWTGKI